MNLFQFRLNRVAKNFKLADCRCDSSVFFFFFDLHCQDLVENSSNSNKLPLIRIKICMLAWGGFVQFDKQIMCISADENSFVD